MNKLMKILIAHDGSDGANAMLDDLHRAGLPRYAEAAVVSVAESYVLLASGLGGIAPAFATEGINSVSRARTLAEQAAVRLQVEFPEWQVRHTALFGPPTQKLLEEADAWQADLMVFGSHGHSVLGRLFFGSVSHNVIHHAPCSVRIARGSHKEASAPIRLIVGVDGSPHAEAALNAIAARAWPPGSEARIVSAYHLQNQSVEPLAYHENADAQLAEWIAAAHKSAETIAAGAAARLLPTGLQTSIAVKEASPKQLLLDEAESWKADCIFVGARGLSDFKRLLLGSVSTAVVTRAHCSVEVVRTHS